jgi:antitoxin component of MazEF toxin-antitoxin module
MGNNLVMTMPKSAIWVTGFSEGEVIEIDVKGENMIIARKPDTARYIKTQALEMLGKKQEKKEPLIA